MEVQKIEKITNNAIDLDTSLTYRDCWQELDKIATSEFQREEKVYYLPLSMEKLIDLILKEMNRYDLSEKEFAKRCLLPTSAIGKILEGSIPGNIEDTLGLLATGLTNPSTGEKFSGFIELADYCQILKKTPVNNGRYRGDTDDLAV